MDMPELVSAATEPINRLIDAVSGAIGKAYEPRYIRKMADAKAYELKTISDELRNNADLPIVYDASGKISVDIKNYEELAKRAGRRIAYQEVARQENIETIVDAAYDSLQGVHCSSEGKISREWMNRFIDSAGDISTEELQILWSKVLAGEVLNPNLFSLRTLDCLKNLEANDAKLFEMLCKTVISNRYIVNDLDFLEKHNIPYAYILKMDECGLLNSSPVISSQTEITSDPKCVIDFGDYILMAKAETKTKFKIFDFPLTAAGRELSTIVGAKMDFQTIKEICLIVTQHNSDTEFSLHKVNDRNEENISYDDTPILFN